MDRDDAIARLVRATEQLTVEQIEAAAALLEGLHEYLER